MGKIITQENLLIPFVVISQHPVIHFGFLVASLIQSKNYEDIFNMGNAIATQTPQEIVLLYLTWMHIICWILDVSSKWLELFGKIMFA